MVAGAISNGGLYVKLGQGLCSFNHLLPPEYIRTLRVLEDKALTRGFQEVSPALGGTEAEGGALVVAPMPPYVPSPVRWTSCSLKTSRPRPTSSFRNLTTSQSLLPAWPRCTVPGCMMAPLWL